MARLLIVQHSPTDGTQRLGAALIAGASDDAIEGVQVEVLSPTEVDADFINSADGILVLSTANFGYMAGLIKDMFDRTFLDIGGALSDVGSAANSPTGRKPFAVCVHGRYDTTGAIRSIEQIASALPWRQIAPALSLVGPVTQDDESAAYELGATISALLA